MVRRRLAVKRIDPWSMLKFAAVANLVLFIVLLLIAAMVWFIIDRLALIDQACEIATEIGFRRCVVDGGTVMRVSALLAGMIAIVNTAVLVFAAFLHNLIADLTGGLVLGIAEEGPADNKSARVTAASATTLGSPSRQQPAASPQLSRTERHDRGELFGEH